MTNKRLRSAIAGAIAGACALGAGACDRDGGGTPDAGKPDADTPDAGTPDDGRQTVVELPVTPKRNLDLLFVVDDSPSMLDKQTNLANNFPIFIDRLNSLPGGLPDLHLGVVTTDMGTKASGSATPGPTIGVVGNGGCAGTGKNGVLQTHGAPVTGNFLRDVKQTDGTRLRNYTGPLATAFGMMARPGAGGCGFEQPLAAMRAALGGQPANVGFLRPDALLGIVFLTDEDDCSAASTSLFDSVESAALGALQSFRCTRFGVTCAVGGMTPSAMNQVGAKGQCGPSVGSALLDDVAPYRDFLRGLKSDPMQIVVSGIMGTTEPFQVELRNPPGGGSPLPALAHSCVYQGSTGLEVADPPVRMKALLDGFPGRSTSATVCQQDLSAGLTLIGNLVGQTIGTPCVSAGLADTDPATPGLQVDCIVEDLVGAAATKIEQCDASEQPPCWKLEVDSLSCMGPGNLKLNVLRTAAPPPSTVTRMRCKVAP